MANKDEAIEFYDEYVQRQIAAGIHHRHLSIQRYLEKFDISRDAKVLEIGCGIGTQSQLLLEYLSQNGSVIGLDIGVKNIEYAQEKYQKYKNADFRAINLVDVDIPESDFDLILCPDVLEHIPIESHDILFAKFHKLLKKDGKVVVHIPHPTHLQWVRENHPEELQIIDQPLYLNKFSQAIYKNNFQIDYLESYSIFREPYDYQIIVIAKTHPDINYSGISNPINDTFLRRIKRKLRYFMRGKK